MPSIRRSLIVYFLILLALALGGVGLIVDRFAGDSIHARESAEAERLEGEYRLRCNETRQQFEKELEQKAQTLGQELRLKYFVNWLRDRERERDRERRADRTGERSRPRERDPEEWEKPYRLTMALLPLVGLGGNPVSAVSGAGILAGGPRVRGPMYSEIERAHTDEVVRQQFVEDARNHPKYFQFQFPISGNLITGPAGSLPLVAEGPAGATGVFPRHEVITTAAEPVFRTVIKYPLSGGPFRGWPDGTRFLAIQSLLGVAGASASPLPPFLLERGNDPFPFVYVHCGVPMAELDVQFRQHEQYRDEQIRESALETQESLTQLRTKLAVIAGLTFVALAVGGWWLVGRGVAPLRKLSDAVSEVSEKDFRLPVQQADLSLELLPIHDRLTHTLDALRRAFEREKQAVADISHELKTPLAALLTTLEVTLRKPRTAEQYRETLEECRTISRQLRRLVDRIMTLASLDAGNDRTILGRVDASDVATECAIIIRPLVEAHGQKFVSSVDSDAEMKTDPDKLREVLMNLLHNAIEYNQPGGTVELRVAAAPGRVTFTVRDTGIGMSPGVQEKIFERFYRADPSRTQTGVHAGLGLAIVKEYLERLGGTISVESEPGIGSTFRVTLPTDTPGRGEGNGAAGRSGFVAARVGRARSAARPD